MFGKALIAFLVLPGIVAGVLPAVIFLSGTGRDSGHPLGYAVIALGSMPLFWCVRDFYVSGKGTLAPWCPPQNLVIVGLYRFLRNPMYASVILILVGWCLSSGSNVLVAYSISVAAMFHLRVTMHEEPWLAQEFGQNWTVYSADVSRWLPRLKPWFPEDLPS